MSEVRSTPSSFSVSARSAAKSEKSASTEALVNTLAVLAPHAPRDKQALLEAKDLKERADVLIALTEMALARQGAGPSSGLQ